MRRIKLYPVRESESENFRRKWRRRTQILGSILNWAHVAGACRIEFDPSNAEPFSYFADDGNTVTTEMGETPCEHVASLAQFIRDTIDGPPAIRPFRRLVRWMTKSSVAAQIEIPSAGNYDGSTWYCTMTEDLATFLKQSTLPAARSNEA